MILPDFLTREATGEIRLTGHRIGLYHVIEQRNRGFSAENILEEYPTLSLDLIHKVLAFPEANRADVNAYVDHDRQQPGRQEALQRQDLRQEAITGVEWRLRLAPNRSRSAAVRASRIRSATISP